MSTQKRQVAIAGRSRRPAVNGDGRVGLRPSWIRPTRRASSMVPGLIEGARLTCTSGAMPPPVLTSRPFFVVKISPARIDRSVNVSRPVTLARLSSPAAAVSAMAVEEGIVGAALVGLPSVGGICCGCCGKGMLVPPGVCLLGETAAIVFAFRGFAYDTAWMHRPDGVKYLATVSLRDRPPGSGSTT